MERSSSYTSLVLLGKYPRTRRSSLRLQSQRCSAQAVRGSVAGPSIVLQVLQKALKHIKGVLGSANFMPQDVGQGGQNVKKNHGLLKPKVSSVLKSRIPQSGLGTYMVPPLVKTHIGI